jgi:hypothetical protein
LKGISIKGNKSAAVKGLIKNLTSKKVVEKINGLLFELVY